MVKKGEKYECLICGKIVEVLEAGSAVPICCKQDMNLIGIVEKSEKEYSKNICGIVVKCNTCGLKLRILKNGIGSLTHCLKEMTIATPKETEIGNICKCRNCGQIIKIQKSGCGPINCCDEEVCEMDLNEIKELEKRVVIAIDSAKDKPYEHKFFICNTCQREVEVLEKGKGHLICHGTEMKETPRIRYYFQGGG